MKTTQNYLFNPVIFALLALSSLLGLAQNVTTPRAASPAAEISQTIGLTDITVKYSRPKLTTANGQDRSGQIWGQLVPYGFNKTPFGNQGEVPWRVGANENTTISFSNPVKLEGAEIPAGIYGMHMDIQESGEVTVILSSNTSSWGSFYYDETEDVARVSVQSLATSKTEALTFEFVDYGVDFTLLSLKWDEKEIPMRIEIDTHNIVLQGFRDELRSLPGFGWQGYLTASRYCLTNGVNLEEGLAWSEIAVQRNNGFQSLTMKAGLLNALGRTAEANTIFDKAGENATIAQINALGYQFLAAKQFDKAIEFFSKNVKNDPNTANGYDSLGDGYKATGEKEKAIKNYKKALSLNPPANVKAASEASLKELGVINSDKVN